MGSHPAGCARPDQPGDVDVRGSRAAQFREWPGAVTRHRRQAVRQRLGIARQLGGERRIPVQCGQGVPDELGKPNDVDFVGRGAQPVPGAIAFNHVGTAAAAGARHQDLQALEPVRRGVVAPDELDQLVG
jgi:hypothetical protein